MLSLAKLNGQHLFTQKEKEKKGKYYLILPTINECEDFSEVNA